MLNKIIFDAIYKRSGLIGQRTYNSGCCFSTKFLPIDFLLNFPASILLIGPAHVGAYTRLVPLQKNNRSFKA